MKERLLINSIGKNKINQKNKGSRAAKRRGRWKTLLTPDCGGLRPPQSFARSVFQRCFVNKPFYLRLSYGHTIK